MEQSKDFKVIKIKIMKKRIYNIKYNDFTKTNEQLSISFTDKKQNKTNKTLKKEHANRKKEKIRNAIPREFVQMENLSRVWESLRSQKVACPPYMPGKSRGCSKVKHSTPRT